MRPHISEEDIQKQPSPQAASAAYVQNGRISVEEFIDRLWDLKHGDPAGHRSFKIIEALTDKNVKETVDHANPPIKAYYYRLLSLCYYTAAKVIGETGVEPRQYLQWGFEAAQQSDAEQWWIDYMEAMAAYGQDDADWFHRVFERIADDHPRRKHVERMRERLPG